MLAQRGLVAQGGQAPPVAAETTATAIPGVIAAGTKVEVIKSGFSGTEGPIGMPDGSLIFTETQANRITRIDANNQTSTFLENTNGSNGLAFDSKGRLISVQTTPGKTLIGVIYPKGQEATLSDNFDGKPFGRPNDLVVDKKGGVYFSEPGPNATPGQPPPTPPLTPAVYYVPPGGKSIRIAEGIERPNGIQLSPDEKTLYVNNTNGEYVLAFDVKPDGTVGNRRNFAKYPSVRDAGGRRIQQRRRRPCDRQRRPRLCRLDRRRARVQPEGRSARHHSAVARGTEHRVCRTRQENALHRRPRLRVQGAVAGRKG